MVFLWLHIKGRGWWSKEMKEQQSVVSVWDACVKCACWLNAVGQRSQESGILWRFNFFRHREADGWDSTWHNCLPFIAHVKGPLPIPSVVSSEGEKGADLSWCLWKAKAVLLSVIWAPPQGLLNRTAEYQKSRMDYNNKELIGWQLREDPSRVFLSVLVSEWSKWSWLDSVSVPFMSDWTSGDRWTGRPADISPEGGGDDWGTLNKWLSVLCWELFGGTEFKLSKYRA